MKIKDYWRHLKEIDDFLPYFLPDKSIESPRISPLVLDGNDLKDALDGNLSQAIKSICKRNQYNVLPHPISETMDYLQEVESTCTTPTRNVNWTLSHTSSSKGENSGKDKDKGKGKSEVGKCPHCNKWHYTKDSDFSDCRFLSGKNKSTTPAKEMTVTNALSINNHHMGWKS